VNRAVQMRLVQTTPEQGQKLADALAEAQGKHGFPVTTSTLFRRSSQFSPGSVSLGSGIGGTSTPAPTAGIGTATSTYQRRSSFGPAEVPQVSPIRHTWSTRNVDWHGDTAQLRSRPELADVRHANVERGENEVAQPMATMPVPGAGGMPATTSMDPEADFNREVEQMRRTEPAEGPIDVERSRTYVSPDGLTRTQTHYSHQRSEY
jgi:hypothetical protein